MIQFFLILVIKVKLNQLSVLYCPITQTHYLMYIQYVSAVQKICVFRYNQLLYRTLEPVRQHCQPPSPQLFLHVGAVFYF